MVVDHDGLTLIVEAMPAGSPARDRSAPWSSSRSPLRVVFIGLVPLLLFFAAVRIVNQYERILIFTLGRTSPNEVKGPGWVFVVPIAQRGIRVDLRERFIEVPSQTGITKDNAPISIDFLIYWRIVDPYKSVIEVQDFEGALQNIATTTLRAVVGDILLDDMLSKREQINEVLRVKLDEVTERWGGKVTTVEIREITPPRDVQDAMNRQLSAERTRRAVITESEGSRQSAINVAEGTKQAEILRAEGDRQAAILRAEGFALALEQIFAAASTGRPEDDGAPVPGGVQGARCEPVDEVHHPARDHPARRGVPRVSPGGERARASRPDEWRTCGSGGAGGGRWFRSRRAADLPESRRPRPARRLRAEASTTRRLPCPGSIDLRWWVKRGRRRDGERAVRVRCSPHERSPPSREPASGSCEGSGVLSNDGAPGSCQMLLPCADCQECRDQRSCGDRLSGMARAGVSASRTPAADEREWVVIPCVASPDHPRR